MQKMLFAFLLITGFLQAQTEFTSIPLDATLTNIEAWQLGDSILVGFVQPGEVRNQPTSKGISSKQVKGPEKWVNYWIDANGKLDHATGSIPEDRIQPLNSSIRRIMEHTLNKKGSSNLMVG